MSNDLHLLLDKALEILRKEINSLFVESAGGKLKPAAARDLVNYIKVLSDVTERQKDASDELAKLSEEELKKLAKQLIE